MRGNNVMKGYYRDPEATAEAFRGGWFHSGDLGVMHPDGYIELRTAPRTSSSPAARTSPRSRWSRPCSSHPAVLEAAVDRHPRRASGASGPRRSSCCKPGRRPATEQSCIDHVRGRIARYKAPDEVDFVDELPKTSTGKIQKFELRDREWAGQTSRIKG